MSNQNYIMVPILFSGVSTSVTGTLVETTLASATLKAGMVGVNDTIECVTTWSYTNVARNKILKVLIGTTAYFSGTVTTTATVIRHLMIHSRGSLASQVAFGATQSLDNGSVTTAVSTFTEDLSVDKTITVTGTLANTGDSIALEAVWLAVWKEPRFV